MDLDQLLGKSERFEIEPYKRPQASSVDCVQFTGTPRKHPFNPKRIILIMEPFCNDVCYLEFKLDDITGMEEMPNLVRSDGNMLPMTRIWVKKGAIAIRSVPFVV